MYIMQPEHTSNHLNDKQYIWRTTGSIHRNEGPILSCWYTHQFVAQQTQVTNQNVVQYRLAMVGPLLWTFPFNLLFDFQNQKELRQIYNARLRKPDGNKLST